MTQISLADAQLKLPELLNATSRGEEFVITLDGKPVAQLAPIAESKKAADPPRSGFGSMKGLIKISDDFDEPLEDFAEYM